MANISLQKLDNRPWIPRHIPVEIREELARRSTDIGIEYKPNGTAWYDDHKTWDKYKGPLTSWVRVCSNGAGVNLFNKATLENKRDGFIMYGGDGFHNTFGINPSANTLSNTSVLGYDVFGKPHQINPDIRTGLNFIKNGKVIQPGMPTPSVVSIDAVFQKEIIRKVTINWKCYGFSQLEYMTPYFLTPKISVIVEFGWNHFNLSSLLDLTDDVTLSDLYINGSPLYNRILQSNGMYEVTFGMIGNFEFTTQDGFMFDCKTEVYSKHRNYSGALINQSPENKEFISETETISSPSLFEFMDKRLKKISTCVEGSGKNFFDSLDPSEDIKFKTELNTDLKSVFYGGKPEDRVCLPRNKVKSDPNQTTPHSIDWDNGETDEMWVSMGFLVELMNLFTTQTINIHTTSIDSYKLFSINIDDVVIGGHPNLISCDGNILLIPNSKAPKFNIGRKYWLEDYSDKSSILSKVQNNQFQKQTYTEPLEIKNDLPNIQLFKIFQTGFVGNVDSDGQQKPDGNLQPLKLFGNKLPNTSQTGTGSIDLTATPNKFKRGVFRDDIDSFINRFRYKNSVTTKGSYSFPQYKPMDDFGFEREAGYWGYLKDLYVNVNTVIEVAKNINTAQEFYDTLLQKISAASGDFWDLKIVESDDELKIIDKKYINLKPLTNEMYQFQIDSTSIIKSLSFTTNMTNAQANQVIASSNNNQEVRTGRALSVQPLNFVFSDRLKINETVQDNKKTQINQSSDIIKQYQKYGKLLDTYSVSFGTPDQGFYKVYSLALPSKSLLLSILNDYDDTKNTNIYGSQQQNFTCEIVLQGISGLRTQQCFSIKNLPRPYSENDVIFQIVDITHNLQNGDWTTSIKASIRPLGKNKLLNLSNNI